MIKLVCPDGHEITGTLETISGKALVSGFEREGRKLVPIHDGETELWWDEQRTVKEHGVIVVVCSDGHTHRITECKEVK